jgi:hypothetical protein
VHELDDVAERDQARVDAVVVGDVLAVVAVRRGVDGVEPQAGDVEPGQVRQPPAQALQVAQPSPSESL